MPQNHFHTVRTLRSRSRATDDDVQRTIVALRDAVTPTTPSKRFAPSFAANGMTHVRGRKIENIVTQALRRSLDALDASARNGSRYGDAHTHLTRGNLSVRALIVI